MKEKKEISKGKVNIYIVGGVLVLLFLGSWISPFLVYLMLLALAGISLFNMIRIEKLSEQENTTTHETDTMVEATPAIVQEVQEAIPKEELPKPMDVSEMESKIKETQEQEIKIIRDYIQRNLEKGASLSRIKLSLVEQGAQKEMVEFCIEPHLKYENHEPIEEDKPEEVKEDREAIKEITTKPKKKNKAKKKKDKAKAKAIEAQEEDADVSGEENINEETEEEKEGED